MGQEGFESLCENKQIAHLENTHLWEKTNNNKRNGTGGEESGESVYSKDQQVEKSV